MPDAVLIQQASGPCVPMLEMTAGRHAAYGQRHGFAYWPVVGEVQTGRATQWNKIVLIRRALEEGFRTIVWMDADTLVVRPERDLREALDPAGGPLGLAWHQGGGGAPDHWNCGVMVMRHTPEIRDFFEAVWSAGPLGRHHWHEQARILDLLPRFPGLVQRLADEWNATEGLTEVAAPVIKAWHGSGAGAALSIYGELKQLGALDAAARAAADRWLVHEDNCVARAAEFIATLAPAPERIEGRGVVICGGGAYFPSVWVNVHQLRRLGCRLPVQVWHLGAEEMDGDMRGLLEGAGVECVDAAALRRRFPARILNGWELKAYALVHAPFRQVLLLDADNVAVRNPEEVFDTPEFAGAGAVFWPDYGRMGPERSAWRLFDVTYRDEPEFETGQILVDKAMCGRELSLALWYNEHSDFFYRHVWGDKDTFRFAWHRLGRPFAMPPFPIHSLEDTMCQHDFSGRRLFQHRNGHKWKIRQPNKRIADFQFEDECLADVERLKGLWCGHVRRD